MTIGSSWKWFSSICGVAPIFLLPNQAKASGNEALPFLLFVFSVQFLLFVAITMMPSLKGRRLVSTSIYGLALFIFWKLVFFKILEGKYLEGTPYAGTIFMIIVLIVFPLITLIIIWLFLRSPSSLAKEKIDSRL